MHMRGGEGMGIFKRIRELEKEVKKLREDIRELEDYALAVGRMEHLLHDKIRIHEEETNFFEQAWQSAFKKRFDSFKEKIGKNQ